MQTSLNKPSPLDVSSAEATDGSRCSDGFRCMDSTELLGQTGELLIRHQGEIYRLRRTRQGKLILTK